MPRFQGVPVQQNRFGGTPIESPSTQMTSEELSREFEQNFRLTPQAKQVPEYLQQAPTFEGSGFLGGSPRVQQQIPELPKNISGLPELQGSGLLSSDKGAAALLSGPLLATTNPEEIADIITNTVPEVSKVYERDSAGNTFPVLVNNKTGAATPINKPGLSGLDVLQTLGLAAAFTPSGRAATVVGGGVKAGATEAAIQGSQAATGGDFGVSDVALSAVGGGVFKGAEQLARLGRADIFRPSNVKLIDQATGLPSQPLQNALKRYDLDAGAIYDDLDNLPIFSGNKTPEKIVDDIIVNKFKRGEVPDALYNKKLVANKVVDDPLGDEALKQGFLKGDIASAKSANAATKQEMKKMLNMKRAIQAQSDKALDFRPSDIVGDSAMLRFNHVRDNVNRLRKELDEVAKKELSPAKNLLEGPGYGGMLKGRQINTKAVADDYMRGLEDLNVSVDSSTIPPKLDFSKSLISEDKTSQRVISSVTRLLAKEGNPDAQTAHMLKRQLDTMLDFNKKSSAGLTDAGEKFAKQIRRSLNESIREVSPRYAAINDKMSAGLEALNSFDKALGGSVDAFADNASRSVGQTLRRLLSNAQTRVNLDTALSNLDDTARQMDGNFGTDIKKLIQFNKTLDDRFGATARGSFQGEIESAVRSGPLAAAKEYAGKKAAQGVESLRGINETNAFNTMQKILSQ